MTDVDGGAAPALSSVDATTGGGGSIAGVNLTTGEFTYKSAPGFTGADTFEFTLTDGTTTRTQTATINVTDTIWFVDNSAAPGGDGTLGSPFDTFTPLNDDGNDIDDPGDVIYVAEGAAAYDLTDGDPAHDAGLVLENNQVLIGEGADDSVTATFEAWLAANPGISVPVNSDPLPAIGGTPPELTNTTGDVVTVSVNNTVEGITLNPVASAGIAGSNVSGLVVSFVLIITSGGTGDNEGISLQTVSGTLTFGNLDIESADGETNQGTAIQIDGGSANLQFNDVDIDQDGGTLLSMVNTFASSLMFDDESELTLEASDEVAVVIADNDSGTVILNNDDISVDTTATVAYSITGNTGLAASTPINDAPVFNIPQSMDVLEDSGAQTVAGFAANVSPGLDPDESTQVLTFTVLSNSNLDLFDVQPTLASDGTLTYTLKPDTIGSADITVQLQDDGGTDDGGIDTTTPKTFTINVTPVNDQPSFVIDGDPAAVPEDAGPQAVAGFAHSISAGPDHESDQTVAFEITANSNPDLFIAGPAISSTGDLTYTPADDAEGTATISVVLRDSGGTNHGGVDTSVTEMFDIAISPAINDAPTFDLVSSIDADIHDGAYSSDDVVANVSPGPDNESGQTVTISISGNTNPDVFDSGPTIDANGNLSFTPSSTGTSTLTIEAMDDGGTEHGGVDAATKQIVITISEANRAPILDSVGNQSIGEGSELAFDVTAFDINGDDLNFSLDGAPSGATITNSGQFSWTPAENQGPQTHTLDVQVTDGEFIDSETIEVTVNEVNIAPVLNPVGDHSIDEGSEFAFTATATDSDLPANSLLFRLAGDVPDGAAITTVGDFTWTPAEQHGPGQFTFDVVVTDGEVPTSETITITVAEANATPVLDSIGDKSIDEGQTLTFTATGSDTDEPTQTLTFSLGGNVPTGASITAAGEFSWTPSESQGPNSHTFDVVISDGIATSTETITVAVDEVNEAPQLNSIGDQSIDERQLLSFTAVATDADLPANTLTLSLAGDVPTGASITDQGLFAWTPNEDQGPGDFTFDVLVFDGTESVSETITVTVAEANSAPVLAAIGNQTIEEGSELSFTASASDTDLPNNTLTFSLGGNVPDGATITPTGDFSFTPNESQGPQTFTFDVVVSDGSEGDSETIEVTVGELNEAPVLASVGDRSVNELETLTFTASATDADLPENTFSFSLSGDVPNGATITPSGEFSWMPTEAQGAGIYSFAVVVSDGLETDSETINVTVNEVNIAPAIDAIDDKTTNENQTLSIVVTATDADLPANSLTFTLGQNAPIGAEISEAGQFNWTPTEAQGPGEYTFDVTVSDGELTDTTQVMIEVADVPDAPILDSIGNHSINELTTLSFTATASDSDLPAETLTFSLTGNVPGGATITSGGEFEWTPTEAQGAGTYTINVVVSDGGLTDSESITITVNEVNAAPVLSGVTNQTVNEKQTLTFTASATDSDLPANTLTFGLAGDVPAGAAITESGSFSWTPTEQQGSGAYTFDVTVGDGTTTSSETITVTVNEVNDAPTFVLDATNIAADLNAGTRMIDQFVDDIAAGPAAEPAQNVTISINGNTNSAIFASGPSIDAGGNLTFAPAAVGTATITVVASDDGGTANGGLDTSSQQFTITISEENLAPLLGSIGDQATVEGDEITFVANASDPNNDTLTYSLSGAPGGAAITSGGAFSWTPTFAQVGTHTFDVVVTDDGEGSLADSETIMITVNSVDPFASVEISLDQINEPGESPWFTFAVDLEVDHDDTNPATKLQFAAPDEPGNFQQLMGGPTSGWADVEQEEGETASEFLQTFSGDWGFRIDFDGNGFSLAEGDEEITIAIDVEDALNAFPAAPTITSPTAGGDISLSGGTPSLTWTGINQNQTDLIYVSVEEVGGNELIDNDFHVTATSVDLIGAQAGTTLEGEVGAVDIDENGDWANRMSGAAELTFALSSFAIFDADVVAGSSGGFEDYEVEFGFLQVNDDGQDLLLAELDIVIDHAAAIEQTMIRVMSPRSGSFDDLQGGWGNSYLDIIASAGETVDQFVASLDGQFDVQVDLDGDGQFDDLQFSFTIDLGGITSNSFPNVPTLSAPTVNRVQRSVTLDWLSVNDGDLLSAAVQLNENNDLLNSISLFDVDLDLNQTSITAYLLPTDVPLTAALGTFDELPSIATGDGQYQLFLANFATADLTINGQSVSVAAGDSAATFGGGSAAIGGIDFDFTGVDQSAEFSGPYFTPSDYDAWAYFLGGEDRLDQSWQDFGITNEDTFQLWQLDLTSNDQDIEFDDVELTFKYDESLLGTQWQTAAEMEPLLAVFHFNELSGEWEAEPLVERSLDDNTITILADEFSAFVLGVSFDDPPVTTDYDAELVVGIAEHTPGNGASNLLGFIEFGFQGADVPLYDYSDVYVQRPGNSEYLLLDGHYFENDHDANGATPPIKHANFDRDFEQGILSEADFLNTLQGTWTVLVDTDGDFDTTNPNEETNEDAKFTFDLSGIDLASIPPAPTISDPIHQSTIDGEGIQLTWDVESGSMAGVEVDVQVFSDDANIGYNQLTQVGQTANVPDLPGGTVFNAEVIHVNESGGYISNVSTAPGFGNFAINDTIGLYAAFNEIEFTTMAQPIAEADFSLVQANFNGDDLKFLNIELDTEDPRTTMASKVRVTTPLQSDIMLDDVDGWVDVKESENGTLTDFISDLSGDYLFEYDFDGDTTFEDSFTVNLDLTSLTSSMFPDETIVTSPIANSVLPVTGREVTISWNENATAEEMFVEVGSNDVDAYFFDVEPDTSATSVTTNALPSGIQLGANVVAEVAADSAVQQTSGTVGAETSFSLATLTPVDFQITPHLKPISPSDSSGFYAGGQATIGGVDYEFTGLTAPANLNLEYFATEGVSGGAQEFAAGQYIDNGMFYLTGPPSWEHIQTWQFSVSDGSGNDVNFTHADLDIRYDESLIDNPSYTVDFIENHLVAYQWDQTNGWQPLTTLSQAAWDDTIQVRATHADAPIVLGFDPSATTASWQPTGQIGKAEMEILRVENVFLTTKFIANIEFYGTHPNAHQGNRIEIKLPGETEFQSYGLDSGTAFIDAEFDSLADLIAARHGTYEVRTHHDADDQFDAEFTVTFDLNGLTESDLPDSPTINAPSSSTVVDEQSTIVDWEPQPDTDGTFIVVFEGSAPSEDNDLYEADLSELQSSLEIDGLPQSQTLLLGVGINQTQHSRATSSSSDGSVDVELELTSLKGIVFGGAALHAASGEIVCYAADTVSQAQLAPIVEAAIERLAESGLTEPQIGQLQSVDFRIANLDGGLIGLTQDNTISIDINAAGHGWFVDPTPLDDDEFAEDGQADQLMAATGAAVERIDLLTAVMHEFGHILGLEDDEIDLESVMYESLQTAVRKSADWDTALSDLMST